MPLDGVLRLIAGLDANAVITTPSVAWALSSRAPLPRIDKLITVGERLSPELRHVLGTRFGAPPQALFAASETVLGYEAGAGPDEFCWDRQRLHLEILDAQGNIRESGSGELLVTRRYGEALPLLRYPLGDRVELIAGDNDGPRFRYLGRTGHGFGLVGGVKVSRSHLESFLDTLSFPIHAAEFHVFHQPEGDRLQIVLGLSSQKFLSAPDIRRLFLTSSIDIADVGASGFIEVDVVARHAPIQAKRRITITERPWRL
jgi:phenylacetate-coenzyme A ligase PaaK-like adenylate-forming protein